jgi:hypothetical protein
MSVMRRRDDSASSYQQPLQFDDGLLRAAPPPSSRQWTPKPAPSSAGRQRYSDGSRPLKRGSSADNDDEALLYDPERPSLTPRVSATLSAAYAAMRRARAFDWGGRTPEWWLSDEAHRFKGRVDYPMEMYGDLLSTAREDAARVAAVTRHVNTAALALGRELGRDEEERYARLRVVEVFMDEVEEAEAEGDRRGERAMKRALDAAFEARALEQRRALAALPRALPKAEARGVEVWRASREEEAVQRAAAAEASRAVASRFVDLDSLPAAPVSRAPRALPASRGARSRSSRR